MLYQTTNPHGGDTYGRNISLDYSANINPLGTPAVVLEAMQQALSEADRYPDPFCRQLRLAIADHEGVAPDDILCGNGAAELIYTYCQATRPSHALTLAPTFAEYALAVAAAGGQMTYYPLSAANGFQLDEAFLPFLAATRPQVLFLCHPNNPTGRRIAPPLLQSILRICQQQGTDLVVDECFGDFADPPLSLRGELANHSRLLLLQAFTKNYALAGIRLGYCLSSNHRLLARLAQCQQPWNVSQVAQAAGIACYKAAAQLQQARELIAQQRPWLQQQLEALGLWVCPSCTNYLLFCAGEGLERQLQARGIAIRCCANYLGLSSRWYRIAVRSQAENRILIRNLQQLAATAPHTLTPNTQLC